MKYKRYLWPVYATYFNLAHIVWKVLLFISTSTAETLLGLLEAVMTSFGGPLAATNISED